ncbi:MAG: thrombospondin type 3 repeat-containing protein [Deltaproteobacteria bacterium]|nr:thrombospondin type 3 repeat-containing protein [Deltaproteobacteria bacterium]MCW5801048.1 thrombospondin type 3 repeat-containing protein [Deltaproteobacteria bacterium]
MPPMRKWILPLALAACNFTRQDGAIGSGDDDVEVDAPDPSDPNDPDGDGVGAGDNCPTVPNADQMDRDGDGVGDACDNCPDTPNPPLPTLGEPAPIQRDHDGDGRGDACDPCPHLAGVDEADPDGDGIGNACDPEPNVKNPPAVFDGFYDEPGAAWSSPAGAGMKSDWVVVRRDDGRIGWRQSVLDGSRRHQLILDGNRREHYIDTSIIIESVAAADVMSNLRSASVSYGYLRNGSNDFYFNCGVRRNVDTSADVVIATALLNDDNRDDASAAWSGGVVNTAIHFTGLGLRVNGTLPNTGDTDLTCTAQAQATQVVTNRSNDFPDGRIGLRTFGMTAWFDYVFYVEPVPAP